MHYVSMIERREYVNEIKDSIVNMEKMISSINESKVNSSESNANQKLLKLKREREKLDRGRKEERAAIIIAKKIAIGNAVLDCLGEDIVLRDDFLEQFLEVVEKNKKSIIESIKKGIEL